MTQERLWLDVAVRYIRKMGWEGSTTNYEARQVLTQLRKLGMPDAVGREVDPAVHARLDRTIAELRDAPTEADDE